MSMNEELMRLLKEYELQLNRSVKKLGDGVGHELDYALVLIQRDPPAEDNVAFFSVLSNVVPVDRCRHLLEMASKQMLIEPTLYIETVEGEVH